VRELADRAEVGFPPAVHLVAVDGPAEALADVIVDLPLPEGEELLAPVDLPAGGELLSHGSVADPERGLLRFPPPLLDHVATELRALGVGRSGRRPTAPLRVRLDPVHIG